MHQDVGDQNGNADTVDKLLFTDFLPVMPMIRWVRVLRILGHYEHAWLEVNASYSAYSCKLVVDQ